MNSAIFQHSDVHRKIRNTPCAFASLFRGLVPCRCHPPFRGMPIITENDRLVIELMVEKPEKRVKPKAVNPEIPRVGSTMPANVPPWLDQNK